MSLCIDLYLGLAEKAFPGGRVWGVGCGVWGFTGFEVANYLIFREKVPKSGLPPYKHTSYG
ncbi:hypothetical protein [Microcystis viridis]|uniref:hypothetical protein n=1 Tax=Microcystis viridis TaxID=44822 RepID=UPI000F76730B|nr:hypothetical protein [Microcystis viridis]